MGERWGRRCWGVRVGGRGGVHKSTRGLGWGGRHWRRYWRSVPLSPVCAIHDLRIS
jgi:hypothetical protein